ncbi:SPARC-related modular calcium-binding protein 1-like isoform X7 [Octopus vulgaris]|nr:SPARC-related modular calcium-binding protein 1-like isoform X7 [Octopus vulgaris]
MPSSQTVSRVCAQIFTGAADTTMCLHCTLTFTNRLAFIVLLYVSLPILFYPLNVEAVLSREKMLFTALRDSDCNVNCTNIRRKTLCASDGLSYQTRCDIQRALQCKNWTVGTDHRRPCPNLRNQQQDNPNDALSDFGKMKRHRGKRRRKGKRGCSKSDREVFNTNLISEFAAEYYRGSPRPTQVTSMSSGQNKSSQNATRKRIVEWKFSQLDRNKDNVLKSGEVRSLKRLVKKLVKPRRCAKSFIDYCDTDQDKRIVSKEWTFCLGLNHSMSFRMFLSLNSEEHTTQASRDHIVSEDHRSCLEERDAAIKINREEPNGQTFTPECTPNGNYKKTQCYNNLCWCVEENTGKSIHATASFNKSVNCDMKPDREMKGCPRSQKRRFLVDLMGEMRSEMKAESNNTDHGHTAPEITLTTVKPDNVVKWKMNQLDRNQNGILERKELRKFKKDLRKRKKKSRKCGRNFLRYCDEDQDKIITLAEFIDCMGVNRNYHSMTVHSHRRGENPLRKYLIDD